MITKWQDRPERHMNLSVAMQDEIDELRAELGKVITDRDEWKESTKDANTAMNAENFRRIAMQAERDALRAENASIRSLMECYNLGGWTDSLTMMKERDALRAELDRLKKQEPVLFVADEREVVYHSSGFVDASRERLAGWKPLYLASGAQPDAKELAELRADVERLDFVLDRCAFIVPAQLDHPCVRYQCMVQDEDENYHVLSGEHKSFSTKREAVDAARTEPVMPPAILGNISDDTAKAAS